MNSGQIDQVQKEPRQSARCITVSLREPFVSLVVNCCFHDKLHERAH